MRTDGKISDLIEMRSLLDAMVTLKRQHKFPWKFDKHLWPQMLFLVDNHGDALDFNYIGLMDHINITLSLLFEQYENVPPEIAQGFLNENIHLDSRSRQHDAVYASFTDYVAIADLNEWDLMMIREVYWLDYQCIFPDL